eukprot:1147998-Pelagomonas_calceolata.AAC.4
MGLRRWLRKVRVAVQVKSDCDTTKAYSSGSWCSVAAPCHEGHQVVAYYSSSWQEILLFWLMRLRQWLWEVARDEGAAIYKGCLAQQAAKPRSAQGRMHRGVLLSERGQPARWCKQSKRQGMAGGQPIPECATLWGAAAAVLLRLRLQTHESASSR